MNVTYIRFSAGGLIDGWEQSDIDRIDMNATTEKIHGILRAMAPNAETVVTWESCADKVYGKWETPNEESDFMLELQDFPWWDFDQWGVLK